MPDVVNRPQIEAAFVLAMNRGIFAPVRKQWSERLRNGEAIQPEDIQDVSDELAALMLLMLPAVHRRGEGAVAFGLGLRGDSAGAAAAINWSAGNARRVADGFAQHTANVLVRAVADGNLDEAVDDVLSKARAERIAATEVTRANTAGEAYGAGRASRALGRKILGYWETEHDPRVCVICRGLNGRPEGSWGQYFEGPPAHPSCRCWVEWR